MNKNQIWANETRASPSGVAGAARPQASVSRTDDVGTSRPEATWATRAGYPTTGLSPQAASAAPSRELPGSSSHSEGPRPAPGRQTPPRWGALMKAAGSAPDPSALAGAFTENAAVTYTEAGVCDAHPASRGNSGAPSSHRQPHAPLSRPLSLEPPRRRLRPGRSGRLATPCHLLRVALLARHRRSVRVAASCLRSGVGGPPA